MVNWSTYCAENSLGFSPPFFIFFFVCFLEHSTLFSLLVKSLPSLQLPPIPQSITRSQITAIFQVQEDGRHLGEDWPFVSGSEMRTVTYFIPTPPPSSSLQCALSSKQMELTTASWTCKAFSALHLCIMLLPLHRKSFPLLLCSNSYTSFKSQLQVYLLCKIFSPNPNPKP